MPRFDPPMVLTEKQEVSHTSLHPQHLKADEVSFPTPSSSSPSPSLLATPTQVPPFAKYCICREKKVPFGSGRAAVWVRNKIIASGRQRLSNTIHVSINQPSALTGPGIYLSNNHTYPAPPRARPGEDLCLFRPAEGADAPPPEPAAGAVTRKECRATAERCCSALRVPEDGQRHALNPTSELAGAPSKTT